MTFRSDRIAHLLGKLHTGVPLTTEEHDECLTLGINPGTEWEREALARRAARASFYENARRAGCSDATYKSIFG